MIDKLKTIIQPILDIEQVELVDIIYRPESGGKVIRLLVDKEGGIKLAECIELNEKIGRVLDESNVVNEKFILEVASPGIDRMFKIKRDYERALGRIVRVTLNERILEKMEYIGRLLEVFDSFIKIDVPKKGVLDISFDKIIRTRQEVGF